MKPIKLLLIPSLLATLLATLSGCAIIITPNDGEISFNSGSVIQGDGQAGKEQRQVGNATGLTIVNSKRVDMLVDVKVGSSPSLMIEADANLLSSIRTEQNGNTLKISIDGNLRSSHPIHVTYTLPSIQQIDASGSAQLVVSGLNGAALELAQHGAVTSQLSGRVNELEISAHGSSKVDASALESGDTKATLRGSSRAQLGLIRGEKLKVVVSGSGSFSGIGAVENLSASTSGSSDINLKALSSVNADLSTSGSGDITAKVTQNLTAHTSGSGRITVLGNPLQRTISGSRVTFTQ
jgi:hypothetical protein